MNYLISFYTILKQKMKFPAKLKLENGITFEGIGFGVEKIGIGEVVFIQGGTVLNNKVC